MKRKSQNVVEEIDLTEESDPAPANDFPGYNPTSNATASNVMMSFQYTNMPHYVPESETQQTTLPDGSQENNETMINETIREMINSFNPLSPTSSNINVDMPNYKFKEWHTSITIKLRIHLVNKL